MSKKEMVTCPWGCGEVARNEYSKHLETKHYKKEDDKITGPYPAGIKKEG